MTFIVFLLTLLHFERPKLYTVLAFLSAIGFMSCPFSFSDEHFDLSGEKKFRVGGGG